MRIDVTRAIDDPDGVLTDVDDGFVRTRRAWFGQEKQRDPAAICMKTGDRLTSVRARHIAARMRKSSGSRTWVRAYYCHACNAWHVGRQDRNRHV